MGNVYFDLTRQFNRTGRIAILASGQAVVYYRLAIMSKDGDWIVKETAEACEAILDVLSMCGAVYRPGAPLDIRWLRGGWSSHFEFSDERGRRVRCDFFSRPPRIPAERLREMFEEPRRGDLDVVDPDALVLMKRTQRAKDYPVISEISRLLPPEKEIEYTTDPDRIMELLALGVPSSRPAVVEGMNSGRGSLVAALALEVDAWRRSDTVRLRRYLSAAEQFMHAFQSQSLGSIPLPEAHGSVTALARELLPEVPIGDAGG